MTNVLREMDLEISVDDALNVRKVDDPNRELQHCMKTVDFIIERQDSYYFIEFKDPEHPLATAQARREFIDGIDSGGLDEDLKYKYRDSFLNEWASGRADKPIYYLGVDWADKTIDIGIAEADRQLETNSATTSTNVVDSPCRCRLRSVQHSDVEP